MDKPKRWVKNVIKKINPKTGYVHILPKIGLKQPSIFYVTAKFFFNLTLLNPPNFLPSWDKRSSEQGLNIILILKKLFFIWIS